MKKENSKYTVTPEGQYNNGVVYRTPEGQLYDTSDQTYLMSPLQDVVVEATASPETKNRMQLEYNKKWQDWHKQYQDWWKNYKAAESKAEQSDMNNYVRKGMDDFGRNYVFPAMTTALTAGLPVISTAGKAAEVLWNPAATITSRFANPLIRGVGKAADIIGVHLPVYRETAADIVSKASGEKNWFTDQQGNFDPFTTAETVLAPFIGAGAVKEGKLMRRAINGASNQLYKPILRVAPENPSKGFEVQSFPGYQLKGLMKGSQLEKQLSKTGTININQLNAYFNKASQVEREIANKVLNEKFAGQKTIDYNQFKKAVQDELIGSYTRVPQTKYADYGMSGIGFDGDIKVPNNFSGYMEVLDYKFPGRFQRKSSVEFLDTETGLSVTPYNFHDYDNSVIAKLQKDRVTRNTFTFESPRIPVGNSKHYDATTLGHSRTYTTPDDPNTLHVMESQSDWGQAKLPNYAGRNYLTVEEGATHFLNKMKRLFGNKYPEDTEQYINLYTEGGQDAAARGKYSKEFIKGLVHKWKYLESQENPQAIIRLTKMKDAENATQRKYLHDNYLQRQLQENLRYAAENGQTKMRYPTSETAAKIEGYPKLCRMNDVGRARVEEIKALERMHHQRFPGDYESDKWREIQNMKEEISHNDKYFDFGYAPAYRTILKKYEDFPKLFQKLYKGQDVRTVTDAKGNTWYEVDVPKGYLNSEWQFKSGGVMKHNPISIKYSNKIK